MDRYKPGTIGRLKKADKRFIFMVVGHDKRYGHVAIALTNTGPWTIGGTLHIPEFMIEPLWEPSA